MGSAGRARPPRGRSQPARRPRDCPRCDQLSLARWNRPIGRGRVRTKLGRRPGAELEKRERVRRELGGGGGIMQGGQGLRSGRWHSARAQAGESSSAPPSAPVPIRDLGLQQNARAELRLFDYCLGTPWTNHGGRQGHVPYAAGPLRGWAWYFFAAWAYAQGRKRE